MKSAVAAVHIAQVTLARRADTATMFLLPTAVGVDVPIVVVIVGFADRDPLVQVFEVDSAFKGVILVDDIWRLDFIFD